MNKKKTLISASIMGLVFMLIAVILYIGSQNPYSLVKSSINKNGGETYRNLSEVRYSDGRFSYNYFIKNSQGEGISYNYEVNDGETGVLGDDYSVFLSKDKYIYENRFIDVKEEFDLDFFEGEDVSPLHLSHYEFLSTGYDIDPDSSPLESIRELIDDKSLVSEKTSDGFIITGKLKDGISDTDGLRVEVGISNSKTTIIIEYVMSEKVNSESGDSHDFSMKIRSEYMYSSHMSYEDIMEDYTFVTNKVKKSQ